MSQERKFARALAGLGVAAQMRENVSQAVRESSMMTKTKLVEPIDYETFLVKSKSSIYNDPQRDLIVFPTDDLVEVAVPRKSKTTQCALPEMAPALCQPSAQAANDARSVNLLAHESMRTYARDWKVVSSKYRDYSGSYKHLPRLAKAVELPEHVFEIDQEDKEEEPRNSLAITKKGWLNVGPANRQDSIGFSFSKAFKKRFFYLKRQQDSTYVLEFFKDDKKGDVKGQIFLDSAVDIVANSKKGRYAFEIRMQDQSFHLLSTDTEAEMNDWIKTLKQVSATDILDGVSQRSLSVRGTDGDDCSLNGRDTETLDSAHIGSIPEILVYAKETASTLATKRKENRQNMFDVYANLPRTASADDVSPVARDEDNIEPFEASPGNRFLLTMKEFKLKLQANIADDGKPEDIDNPEPFFLTFALYDAKEGRKISENAHLDCNSSDVWGMLPQMHAAVQSSGASATVSGVAKGLGDEWPCPPAQLVFAARKDYADVYLVVLIDKVLQGSMSVAVEPYLKGADLKAGTRVHRLTKQFCATLGHHHMPFAWAAKHLCRTNGKFDLLGDMVLYKQEPGKLSEDDLLKRLQDLPRLDKSNKWQQIPAEFSVKVNVLGSSAVLDNVLTSSLELISTPRLSPDTSVAPLTATTLEVEEFPAKAADVLVPFTVYKNHLYVYPKNLKLDGVKNIKARNIACCVQLMECDDENAVPLKCIYARPRSRGSVFVTSAMCAVVHHSTNPDFYEEVKVRLPVHISEHHHLLFVFYHVSCEGSTKAINRTSSLSSAASTRVRTSTASETIVGYAWLPLMKQKRVMDGEFSLCVAPNLPTGYLVHENLGLGKTAGPDVKWYENGKALFKVALRLHSTIYTCDQHLNGFFQHCQKFVQPGLGQANEIESKNALKAVGIDEAALLPELVNRVQGLHAVDSGTIIQFLPTLLNQLFRLLTQSSNKDVTLNIVRVIVHIVHEVSCTGKTNLLHSYVKHVFDANFLCQPPQQKAQSVRTVHEDLLVELSGLLRPNNADSLVLGKFLKHSWFFLEVLIKSMTQHLLSTNRIKMARTERFPSSKDGGIVGQVELFMQMVMLHVFSKHKESPDETRQANRSIAEFIKNLFTLIDRGLVFKLVNMYMGNFGHGDSKVLQEYKFEFLKIVCSHEHYVQLNLPTLRSGTGNKDFKTEYILCDEYRRKHFLAGLLLQELRGALNERGDVRRISISTFRNMIAKHALDDRYQAKLKMGRIAVLYLPFLAILLENVSRLTPKEASRPQSTYAGGGGHDGLDSISMGSASEPKASMAAMRTSQRSSMAAEPTMVQPQPLSSSAGAASGGARESTVLALIAGQGILASTPMGASARSSTAPVTDGRSSPSGSVCSDDSTATFEVKDDRFSSPRSPSNPVRYDKLETGEVKDLLLCFLFILSHLPEDILIQWIGSISESDLLNFFELLTLSLHNFQYVGKRRLASMSALYASNRKASTLPTRRSDIIPKQLKHLSAYGGGGDSRLDTLAGNAALTSILARECSSSSADDQPSLVLLDGCLVTETGMVVLDVLSVYTTTFKAQLDAGDGDNNIMACVFDLHLLFLQLTQSEHVLRHSFALIRLFMNKFPSTLFGGGNNGTSSAAAATLRCGRLCHDLLRCCSARLASVRVEACVTLYHLMKANYEFTKRKNFMRVTLQLVVSVSQLISDKASLANARFIESLAILNNHAISDKVVQRTPFVNEVKKLTKRLRTVLMAMAQLKEHEADSEKLVDLQYSLAGSYASSSPQLRQTWLESMARRHIDCANYTEAAHCFLHIAGLVAEFLKRKDIFPGGCSVLNALSANIEGDETEIAPVDDSGIDDTQYTEDTVIEALEMAAQLLFQAERYEALGALYRLIIPIYERRHSYQRLAACYQLLHHAYSKVVEVGQTGRRLLGTYFRVAFYGEPFEEENGKEYIYKEPKLTTLSEICDRLKGIYGEKYGPGNVRLIQDSRKVNPADLDQQFAYCQVTFVTPYFEESERLQHETDFERNEDVRRFLYQTPFTLSGRAHGAVHEQCRRHTVLTTSHSFPYVKKRIPVAKTVEWELSPIDVAVEEMRAKVVELASLVNVGGSVAGGPPSRPVDMIKLQLKLQGAVSTQVNAGPLAYAEAFLTGITSVDTGKSSTATSKVKGSTSTQQREKAIEALKQAFREFIWACHLALELNSTLISPEQTEYHEAMKANFLAMCDRLSAILGEKLPGGDACAQQDGSSGLRLSVGLLYSPTVSTA